MQNALNEILSHFQLDASIQPYGNGHINDTYVTEGPSRFILQRINTKIFKDPVRLMDNIEMVTRHLKKKILQAGGNPNRETLTVIRTLDNKLFYTAEDGNAYRVYRFIEDTKTYDLAETPEQLYHAGKAFGKFQRMLSDFPAEQLSETIPDFHNTEKRVENLKQAIAKNPLGRAETVPDEIEFALSYSRYAGIILNYMQDGSVPSRVTHNDTKINNVLLDKDTDEGVCVIDLDTVMPGSVLFDFGDALRTGAATANEDEQDLSKMSFDLDFFRAFAKGFLSETASVLTPKEIELLPVSALILTYECGIRFLEDYLNGDVYFKIHRENHNLDRTRTQFKLVQDIEEKLPQMIAIIQDEQNKLNG